MFDFLFTMSTVIACF